MTVFLSDRQTWTQAQPTMASLVRICPNYVMYGNTYIWYIYTCWLCRDLMRIFLVQGHSWCVHVIERISIKGSLKLSVPEICSWFVLAIRRISDWRDQRGCSHRSLRNYAHSHLCSSRSVARIFHFHTMSSPFINVHSCRWCFPCFSIRSESVFQNPPELMSTCIQFNIYIHVDGVKIHNENIFMFIRNHFLKCTWVTVRVHRRDGVRPLLFPPSFDIITKRGSELGRNFFPPSHNVHPPL